MRKIHYICCSALALTLSACAAVSPGDGSDPCGTTYFGIVDVESVPVTGPLQAARVRTLGAGWDGSAFLGWRDEQWVKADPSTCQISIIVWSAQDAEHAVSMLKNLGDKTPCIADFSNSQAP